MCLGLGLLESLTGQKSALKAQKKQAEEQSQNAILQAQAAAQQLETNSAQQQAEKAAADLLSAPIESTDVTTGEVSTSADETTGRKASTRSRFQASSTDSGLSIP